MSSPTLKAPVVIVGAGISGLVTAVELSARGIPVAIHEQRPKAGGRAYSFVDDTTGDVIDNGQHVLIAGYARTLRFLERIGTSHLLTIQPKPALRFHHPERGFCSFSLPAVPSPWHLLAGILSTNLLSGRDKLRLLRAGVSLQFSSLKKLDQLTIAQWLADTGQSDELKRSFWEPLAIAIMNEHCEKASAGVFVHALRIAFLGPSTNSALVVPSVGLSELYVDAATAFIVRHGGTIRYNTDVCGLVEDGGSVRAVRVRGGSEVPASAVVLAVPHYRLDALLPESIKHAYADASSIESTPIVSIHLWYEHDFMPQDFVGVIGRTVQWVFNKRKINSEQKKGGHVSCVISSARAVVDYTNDELVTIAVRDLQSVFGAHASSPVHSVVIREKRATFSCSPGTFRPAQATSLPNLFLAGDWTATGLPATIEGAVISGERCAALTEAFLKSSS